MYITAPLVNYSILCIATIVHLVAFVMKMVVVVVACLDHRHIFLDACEFEPVL